MEICSRGVREKPATIKRGKRIDREMLCYLNSTMDCRSEHSEYRRQVLHQLLHSKPWKLTQR
jgi:hypothetical protein